MKNQNIDKSKIEYLSPFCNQPIINKHYYFGQQNGETLCEL